MSKTAQAILAFFIGAAIAAAAMPWLFKAYTGYIWWVFG